MVDADPVRALRKLLMSLMLSAQLNYSSEGEDHDASLILIIVLVFHRRGSDKVHCIPRKVCFLFCIPHEQVES